RCCLLHLRSFPTRRSSDLQIPARAIGPADLARGRLAEAPLAGELIDQQHALAILRQPGRGVVRLLAALAPASMAEIHRRSGDMQDRKSTRLNSSHVKISYA